MEFFGTPHVEKLKAKKNVKGLINALRYQNDPYVRQEAAEALGQLAEKRAVEPLLALLNDPRGRVRRAAVDALGDIGDRRAVPPLLATLHYTWEHIGVRIGTIEALGTLGDEQAIEPLTVLLQDRVGVIRVAAVEALRQIVRQPDNMNSKCSERRERICSEIPREKGQAMRKKPHNTSLLNTVFAPAWLMKSETVSFVVHLVKSRGKMFSLREDFCPTGWYTRVKNGIVESSYTAWLLP